MHFLDPETLIQTGGLLLIAFIVFAESGLLFGFFFPGDTLLFTVGLLASTGEFSIQSAVAVILFSAILGGQTGYLIGDRYGRRLFRKKDGILFRHEYVTQAEAFYEKHGGKTIILARFVPIVRTFAPVVAGIGKMDIKRFTIYNIVGSGIWAISITLVGYYFGSQIPNIEKLVMPIILAAMLLSFAPAIYHIVKDPKARRTISQKFKKIFN